MAVNALVLVHGAGSGPDVFKDWPPDFAGVECVTVDLHEHIDVSRASMADYRSAVVAVCEGVPSPFALCGWSMGGLVAMMAAGQAAPAAVVVLEPSPPAEIQGWNGSTPVSHGVFDPEIAYGSFPSGFRSRPESSRARSERKRGISIPRVDCPLLVVYGDQFPDERGRQLADYYHAQQRYVPGRDHWGLVLDPAVRRVIKEFLAAI